jgi:hypothetical protein
MALKRRELLWLLSVLGEALLACSPAVRPSKPEATYVELATKSAPGGGAGTILVCMPETSVTLEVYTGLCDELSKQFRLVAIRVDSRSASSVIQQGIARHRPRALVLMNNPTVAAYREYQRESGLKWFPPAVIVMTSFLDERPEQVLAATGISYEVPLITVVTNLRKVIATPIERVGVARRDKLAGFVARQAALAHREQIRVVEEPISADPNPAELKRALRRLKQRCDVVWVLNDDRLLSAQLIADGWLPGLNERRWVPAIVGVASLVSPAQSFGTFAVLPDHTALGVQAANLVFDIAANGWALPTGARVEPPLSTTTSVDLTQVRERFELRTDALTQVDRILE